MSCYIGLNLGILPLLLWKPALKIVDRERKIAGAKHPCSTQEVVV